MEYQSLFSVISPIEKSAILKIIKESFTDLEDNYERLYFGLKDYLVKYQNEDISPLVFVMFGQIAKDFEKTEKIDQFLEFFPDSPELQFYKIEKDIDKGIFEDIDKVLELARLKDEEREQIFHRLVSADRVAKIIMDLQSFAVEISFYVLKEQFDKIKDIYNEVEPHIKDALAWSQKKNIIYILELCTRLILQFSRHLLTAQNISAAVEFFEREDNQEIFQKNERIIMRANILETSAVIYYSAGQPTTAIKEMEKALELLPKIHGRKSWKSNFYHNYGYMLTVIDKDRCLEAYEKCLELIEDSEDYQSIASALGNLISLQVEHNNKKEARQLLKQLVEILEMSEELITPFRAYSVTANAISLDDYKLAHEYMQVLEKKVEEKPSNFNKGLLAGAKMYYYSTAEINYEKYLKWGNESLYYFNKQQDYLGVMTSLYNLTITDFQFYKISDNERYLNSSKKHVNELLTLVGKLDSPTWIGNKNITLAGFAMLGEDYNKAKKILAKVPKTDESSINNNKQMMSQLLAYRENLVEKEETKKEVPSTEGQTPVPQYSEYPLLNEIASDQEAQKVMAMHLIEKTLLEMISLPTEFEPIKADIKLILLINSAGMTLYTKIFDTQKINQQLISNFISAIDTFGKQLFGTKEPYFSFRRGNNIILFQNINSDLNIAMIVTKENYDAIMKLNTLSKEIDAYLDGKSIDLNESPSEDSPFYKWLQEEIEQITS